MLDRTYGASNHPRADSRGPREQEVICAYHYLRMQD